MIRAVLGKIADKKLMALGFKKIEDCKCVAAYKCYNKEYGCTQVLDLMHELHGRAVIKSYDPDLMDSEYTGCCCIGITVKEAVAASMKIISKGWNRRRRNG